MHPCPLWVLKMLLAPFKSMPHEGGANVKTDCPKNLANSSRGWAGIQRLTLHWEPDWNTFSLLLCPFVAAIKQKTRIHKTKLVPCKLFIISIRFT